MSNMFLDVGTVNNVVEEDWLGTEACQILHGTKKPDFTANGHHYLNEWADYCRRIPGTIT